MNDNLYYVIDEFHIGQMLGTDNILWNSTGHAVTLFASRERARAAIERSRKYVVAELGRDAWNTNRWCIVRAKPETR